jgi:hypothetical protein
MEGARGGAVAHRGGFIGAPRGAYWGRGFRDMYGHASYGFPHHYPYPGRYPHYRCRYHRCRYPWGWGYWGYGYPWAWGGTEE